MKKMQRYFLLVIIFTGMLFVGTACQSASQEDSEGTSQGTAADIVCLNFAEAEWTKNILGENPGNLTLQLLNADGVDMHSYQPSLSDFTAISDCQLLIYTGGESESWVNEALESSQNPSQEVLCFMDLFVTEPTLFPTYVQDCDEEESHEEHGEHGEHGNHDVHEHEIDEHLWLSLKMAMVFCQQIEEKLSALDPENQSYYQGQAQSYISQLSTLDMAFETLMKEADQNTILVADRFPFKYLFDDYGIDHVAAFPGCSAETEASFETILSLSKALDQLSLRGIVILDGGDEQLAKTIMENSSQKELPIYTLYSLQSLQQATKGMDAEITYLGLMEQNLKTMESLLCNQ